MKINKNQGPGLDEQQATNEFNQAAEASRQLAGIWSVTQPYSGAIEAHKKVIVAFASNHPEIFGERSTYRFEEGVSVSRAVRVDHDVRQEEIDLPWLERFLSTPSAQALKVDFDWRRVDFTDPEVAALLREACHSCTRTATYRVTQTQSRKAR